MDATVQSVQDKRTILEFEQQRDKASTAYIESF